MEDEYLLFSDSINEIFFINSIMEFMQTKMKTPIKVNVQNKLYTLILQNTHLKLSKIFDKRYHLNENVSRISY